jgi:hypothetical protein
MADQIAANQSHLSPDDAATVVGAHLRAFWTPAMLAELTDAVDSGSTTLTPVAAAAVALLHQPSRTP